MMQQRNGFALAEALVALGVIAVMTGLFFQVMQSHICAGAGLADRELAMLVAQSALARAQAGDPLGQQGGDARFRWVTETSTRAGDARSGRTMTRITVTVTGRAAGRVLATLDGEQVGGS